MDWGYVIVGGCGLVFGALMLGSGYLLGKKKKVLAQVSGVKDDLTAEIDKYIEIFKKIKGAV